jgi:hypothetical protein
MYLRIAALYVEVGTLQKPPTDVESTTRGALRAPRSLQLVS